MSMYGRSPETPEDDSYIHELFDRIAEIEKSKDYAIHNQFDNSSYEDKNNAIPDTVKIFTYIYNEYKDRELFIAFYKLVNKSFRNIIEFRDDCNLSKMYSDEKLKFIADKCNEKKPKIYFCFDNPFTCAIGLAKIEMESCNNPSNKNRNWIEEWNEDKTMCTLPELQEIADDFVRPILNNIDSVIKEYNSNPHREWTVILEDIVVIPN